MIPDYNKLFSTLETPEPPAGLTEVILARIYRRERMMLAIKIGVSASIFGVSMGVAIAGGVTLISNLSQSGFFQITSLMFSDFSSMAANLPDFAFSIVESFPVFTAAILLSGVMLAIWSMAALIDETALMRAGNFVSSK